MLKWKKMGIIFDGRGIHPLANSHTMVPCPTLMDDRIRLYYTSCCEHGLGRPFFVDLDLHNLKTILGTSSGPVLNIGLPGTFDENGVICCSLVNINYSEIYMYYAGFELGTKVRYRLLTGLAKSEDGGQNFIRVKKTPILERSENELYFRGGPFTIKSNDNFEMWYVAGSSWMHIGNKEMPQYDIRHITSTNGVDWPEQGKIKIPLTSDDEFAFGRPAVIKLRDNKYWMFYSIRKKCFNEYRLGFAYSSDKINWKRDDEFLNLNVSADDFETDAIMYATPLIVGKDLYLFYNGNNFGQSGIALAKLENFDEIDTI